MPLPASVRGKPGGQPQVSEELRRAFLIQSEDWLCALQHIVDDEVQKCRTELLKEVGEKQLELDSEWRKLLAERELLTQERADLVVREEALEREKQTLQGSRSPSDVVDLNVGGQITCSVRRSTMLLEEHSALASIFSGRWDDSLERDKSGRIFIDFSPDIFMPLVDFLRQKTIENPDDPVEPPEVAHEKMAAFKRMLEYYNMLDAVWPRPEGRWEEAWGQIEIGEDARMLTVSAQRDPYHAAAFNVLRLNRGGPPKWDLLVSKTRSDAPWYYDSFAVGVVKARDHNRPHDWKASYRDLSLNLRGGTNSNLSSGISSVDSTDMHGVMHAEEDAISITVTQEPDKLTMTVNNGTQLTTSVTGIDLSSESCCLLVAVTYPWIRIELVTDSDRGGTRSIVS